MRYSKAQLWERFQRYYREYPAVGLALDISRMDFDEAYLDRMAKPMAKAFAAMAELEAGAIANPDEQRQVGHYWLRNPKRAPDPAIAEEIEATVQRIKEFAAKVHDGRLQGAQGPFTDLLLIGIGGSALGPQFVYHALRGLEVDPKRKLTAHFIDNTDPDGIDRVLSEVEERLGQTLCVVISKSGGTPETANGMLEAQHAYEKEGLVFAHHAVAITQCTSASKLFTKAQSEEWIDTFPMWEWVGGRTSETSAVGLLPAALQGFDIDALLRGARECDEVTRQADLLDNPAACMALMWYKAGHGRGDKAMVVLPYKDRLEWFSRYLQQLVMESLGKELDLDGRIVHQGLTVYGNKGSTDQHAYVQQLREGLNNFFVTFIEVLEDRHGPSLEVASRVTAGDYLSGFLLGTRQALFENQRESITVTVPQISPYTIGVLIALFERTVGLYASLINVNAYHQPGVQAGKDAANHVLHLQREILDCLEKSQGQARTVQELASAIGAPDECETVFKICEHLAANPNRGVRKKNHAAPAHRAYYKE